MNLVENLLKEYRTSERRNLSISGMWVCIGHEVALKMFASTRIFSSEDSPLSQEFKIVNGVMIDLHEPLQNELYGDTCT